MAVAKDATMAAGNSADGKAAQVQAGTSITTTGITVGGSATLLVVTASWQSPGTPAAPGSPACTWNSVSMTAQSHVSFGTNENTVYIFTLVNPASGAKSLVLSWTTSLDCYLSAISFTGTDTSTGVKVADNTTATSSGTSQTITVTSTTDGATVAVASTNSGDPTMTQTGFWTDSPFSQGAGGSYAIGGTSNAHQFTFSAGDSMALAGVHVIAPAGGGGRGLFRPGQPTTGIGVGGSFFKDPLQTPVQMVRRDRIYVPTRFAA